MTKATDRPPRRCYVLQENKSGGDGWEVKQVYGSLESAMRHCNEAALWQTFMSGADTLELTTTVGDVTRMIVCHRIVY